MKAAISLDSLHHKIDEGSYPDPGHTEEDGKCISASPLELKFDIHHDTLDEHVEVTRRDPNAEEPDISTFKFIPRD